ncbi:MAG: T9SS type B sorting domain-containing protein [Crocinitomix sp.]|nr:T9SS type B sorting domain-containing protein [Crocinitomix sp.]
MKKHQITNSSLLLIFLLSFSNVGLSQHWSIMNIAGNGETVFEVGDSPLDNGFVSPKAIAKGPNSDIYFTTVSGFSEPVDGSIYKLSADYTELQEVLSDVYSLTGVAVDKNGNIYFSKGFNALDDGYSLENIWVIPAGSDTPIVFAGNGYDDAAVPIYPENGDYAIGVPIGNAGSLEVIADEDGNEYLYYSAVLEDNHFIQKINITTGKTYRVAGIPSEFDPDTYSAFDSGSDATDVKLSLSLGLGSDSKGNVYYLTGASGEDAYSVKKIVDGKIYHVAGNGAAGYSGNEDLAKFAGLRTNVSGFSIVNDTMYLCDFGNYVIRRIPLSTTSEDDGIITQVAGTTFNEGDPDAEMVNDITGTEKQYSNNTNMYPIDMIYIDGSFIITDINSRIRKMFWCINPVITNVTADIDVFCLGDTAILTLSKGATTDEDFIWGWQIGDCDIDAESETPSPYIEAPVTAESVTYYAYGYGGCAYKQECFPFEVKSNCKDFYNAITPNSDGLNEFVDIPVLNNFPTNTVIFYNRWGGVLEQIENYDNNTVVWKGTNGNGDPVDSGTYYFTAESGGELITSGWIQVIREQ